MVSKPNTLRALLLAALLAALPAGAASPEFGAIRLECTAAVTHQKVSAVSDGGDAAKVLPSDWNATHHAPTVVVEFSSGDAGSLVWTSQPAGVAEFQGGTGMRARRDLTRVSTCRVTVDVHVVGGATPAKIRIQYTTDTAGASGWAYLDASAGPSANINTTGTVAGSYITVTAAAKADVLLRVVGIDG